MLLAKFLVEAETTRVVAVEALGQSEVSPVHAGFSMVSILVVTVCVSVSVAVAC